MVSTIEKEAPWSAAGLTLPLEAVLPDGQFFDGEEVEHLLGIPSGNFREAARNGELGINAKGKAWPAESIRGWIERRGIRWKVNRSVVEAHFRAHPDEIPPVPESAIVLPDPGVLLEAERSYQKCRDRVLALFGEVQKMDLQALDLCEEIETVAGAAGRQMVEEMTHPDISRPKSAKIPAPSQKVEHLQDQMGQLVETRRQLLILWGAAVAEETETRRRLIPLTVEVQRDGARLAKERVASLETALARAKVEVQEAEKLVADLQAQAASLESDTSMIGVLRGSLEEVGAATDDPRICVDRIRLKDLLKELSAFEGKDRQGARRMVRAKSLQVYYNRSDGQILAQDVLETEGVDGGGFTGGAGVTTSPWRLKSADRVTELEAQVAARRRPIVLSVTPEVAAQSEARRGKRKELVQNAL